MTPRLKKRLQGRQAGFTILELLIALDILAIGLLMGVFPLQISSIRMNQLSFQKSIATELAHETLDNFNEIIAGTPWPPPSDPAGYVLNPGVCPNDPGDSPAAQPYHIHTIWRSGTQFTRVWQVEAVPGLNNLRKITVFVHWARGERTSGQVSTSDMAPDALPPGTDCLWVQVSGLKYCSLGDDLSSRGVCI